MNKKKSILTAVAVVGVIGAKLIIKFGASYGITEAAVAASKSEPWTTEFKSAVVENCSQAVIAESKKTDESLKADVLGKYGNSYCSCVFSDIEKAHIIPTKYNIYKTTEEEYVTQVDGIINNYMDSVNGQKVVNDCIASAQEVALRLPASENEEAPEQIGAEDLSASDAAQPVIKEESL